MQSVPRNHDPAQLVPTSGTTPPTHAQEQAFRTAHHPFQGGGREGVRDDCEPWARPNATRTRPELTNRALVRAVAWMHARRGREWTVEDAATLAELQARAFGFGEAGRLKYWSLPSWVTPEIVPSRRMGGYSRFLAILIHTFRQCAAGLLVSYEEAMSLCDCASRQTWYRWTREMEALGLVRIVQTWEHDKAHALAGRRRFGRLLYRIGPKLEDAAGFGILEGAPGLGDKAAKWAARAAMGARAKARGARKEAKAVVWQRSRGVVGPETAAETPPERPPDAIENATETAASAPNNDVHTVLKSRSTPAIRTNSGPSGRDTENELAPLVASAATPPRKAQPAVIESDRESTTPIATVLPRERPGARSEPGQAPKTASSTPPALPLGVAPLLEYLERLRDRRRREAARTPHSAADALAEAHSRSGPADWSAIESRLEAESGDDFDPPPRPDWLPEGGDDGCDSE